MKVCLTKTILLISVLLLTACGGGKWETEYQFPGFERTQSLEMLQADNGQIYVVGKATNTEPQSETFFVAAFSKSGNLLWDQALASIEKSRAVRFGESMMTVDSQNNLYVALGSDTLPLQVYKISSAGELVDSWYPPVAQGARSNDIEVGPDNRLYLFSSRAVFVYSLEGDLIWNSADNGFQPSNGYVSWYSEYSTNNMRFMDNGDILFFDRSMILVYDTNEDLLNVTPTSDFGMTEIQGAEIIGDTLFLFGAAPQDYYVYPPLYSLNLDLTYKNALPEVDDEYLEKFEIGVSAGRLCFGVGVLSYDQYSKWTDLAYYDEDLNKLVSWPASYTEVENHRWYKQKLVGAPSGCYYAEYGDRYSEFEKNESRVVRFDINGDRTELSRFKNYRIVDFVVKNSSMIQVGDLLDENSEAIGIKLARQSE